MAQPFIGKPQWEYGDPRPTGHDPREPLWLPETSPTGEDYASEYNMLWLGGKGRRTPATKELANILYDQHSLRHNVIMGDYKRKGLMEEPNVNFGPPVGREITDLIGHESSIRDEARSLGRSQNPDIANIISRGYRHEGRNPGFDRLQPRMLIDALYRK